MKKFDFTPKSAVPTDCTCWDKPPTVPVFRDPMTHLDDCPMKGSGKPVGLLRAASETNPADRIRAAIARGDIHSVELARALAQADICPRCLGELDTGWECNDCGFGAEDLAMLDRRIEEEQARHPLWKPSPYPPHDPRHNAVVDARVAAGLPARHPDGLAPDPE